MPRKVDRRKEFEHGMDAKLFLLGTGIVAFPVFWVCERYLGFSVEAEKLVC